MDDWEYGNWDTTAGPMPTRHIERDRSFLGIGTWPSLDGWVVFDLEHWPHRGLDAPPPTPIAGPFPTEEAAKVAYLMLRDQFKE